ncbi:EAL domain-containing protein [Colwelliaceae bacterium 6471]
MRLTSLNYQIIKLVFGLLFVTATAILITVWTKNTEHAQAQLQRDLLISENVFQQLLSSRETQLFNSANILVSDFGFKQAIASQDKGTIDSVLVNHGERIGANTMAVISLNGNIIATTNPAISDSTFSTQTQLLNETINNGGMTSLMVFDNKLYQVIMLTVDAPTPIALTLLGFEIDQALLNQLKSITQMETTVSVEIANSAPLVISTLDHARQIDALANVNKDISWFEMNLFKKSTLVSQQFILSKQENKVIYVTLTENMSKIFSEFNQLQVSITLIALISILLALIFALILSRQLSKPLSLLSKVASKISGGEYQTVAIADIKLTEVKKLSDAFDVMQTNIQARESKIIHLAHHDLLTQLSNRFDIQQRLNDKLAQPQSFQVVGINIKDFRSLNDVFGYHNGDFCLQELAKRIEKLGGLAARLTGGELLWLPEHDQSLTALNDIKHQLEHPIVTPDVTIKPKLALGILSCPTDASSAEVLFKRMNIVLDESQLTKSMVLEYHPLLEERYVRKLAVVTELKQVLATENDELALFYQPKLTIADNKILNVEALIRWQNKQLGFVSPEEFITLAEQSGIIEQVTLWVINQAIDDAIKLREAGITICIAINLSAQDILNKQLLPYINDRLTEHKLPVTTLSFEITESDILNDPLLAIAQMSNYRNHGFSLAIDDFGTGYSSLEYLKNLPVSALKVDKSFVLNLAEQTSDQSIVQTVIKLAHEFNLSVIAEGVENEASLALLKQWQCEFAQGYFISRPIPLSDLLIWHQAHTQHQWI